MKNQKATGLKLWDEESKGHRSEWLYPLQISSEEHQLCASLCTRHFISDYPHHNPESDLQEGLVKSPYRDYDTRTDKCLMWPKLKDWERQWVEQAEARWLRATRPCRIAVSQVPESRLLPVELRMGARVVEDSGENVEIIGAEKKEHGKNY